jgi:hypothetical protein
MKGEYTIRTNVHARTFVLTTLPVDHRDDLAGPEGAFILGCHTGSTRHRALLLHRRRRSHATFGIIASSVASAPKEGGQPGFIGEYRSMLQSIRDGLGRHKWLQYTLLGALALVFAAWGAYGIVNLNVDNANYAAEAGGQKISMQEARNAWLRCSSASAAPSCPDALRTHFQDQVLEGLIREALMTDRTHDLGYRAPCRRQDAITKEPAFQIEGKYSADAAKAAARAGRDVGRGL